MRHLIVGTAGHIDHGKTALVKALTGIDADRLKEEKLRGITIDLGFAHMELGDLQVGFVDVPGHERFVKNMLAGVGGIDCVLLVVAADESIMPQTREHFDICRLLGVPAGIVVITKIDTVEPELLELVEEEISETVAGSFLEDAPIIPVSSRTGTGVDRLKEAIRGLADGIASRPADRKLRLPIDRAFSMRGFGTVVTGTLTAGQIRKDDEVELVPGGMTARVRGIQVHGSPSEGARAGQRTAVNLQGVDLSRVHRGMALVTPKTFSASQLLDVRIELLDSARPLKNLVKVRFHQGTAEVLARVALLGRDSALSPGERAFAQLRLDAPAFCLHGDAFILRQFSPAITVGGGKVLNPHPAKRRTTDVGALALLEHLDEGSLPDRILAFVDSKPMRALELGELNSLIGDPDEELLARCSELAGRGRTILISGPSPILVNPATVKSLQDETLRRISAFHKRSPLQKGISREELRKKVYDRLPQDIFKFSLERLVEEKKIVLQDEMVALAGHEVQLSEQGESIRERIEALYRSSGYQPPGLAELPAILSDDPEEVRKIYHWMLKEKILVRISEELAYHHHTLEEIKDRIRSRYTAGSKFGVAEFKELFDLTRKHAIPLLEFLDRQRFTRRQGNDRILL